MMHPVAFAAVLALAAALPAQAQNADAGAKKVAQCIGCHGIPGYQSSFPEVHKVPMIAGQSAKYIESALKAYAKGDRKHPTMRGIAGSMTEQDMADVAAYYERQGGSAMVKSVAARQPSAEVQALLTKGACASCHGEDFAKPIDPSYPKIAGQHADYLYVALKSYQVERNPQVGRNNAIMGGVAKQFTPAELKALAGYLGSLPGPLVTQRQSPFR
jgi:cytochrome c553